MCQIRRSCCSPISPGVFNSSNLTFRSTLCACLVLAIPLLLAPLASCRSSALSSRAQKAPPASGFRIESPDFSEGNLIPRRLTCEGADDSPALEWSDPPAGTRSFVLIVEDPDAPAGIWTHWVAYNLPAGARKLPANMPKKERVAGGGIQGLNSFGNVGYGGPCPPPGNAHRYFFRLYALDTTLNLGPGSSRRQVLAATKGHILGEAHLMGRFKR